MYEVEQVLAVNNNLGECPLWNSKEKALYWVDINGKTINRFWPSNGKHDIFDVGIPVGAFAFRNAGGFVMATSEGFAYWDSETNKLDFIADPEAGKEEARFNDGKVDRSGRFWAGTMTPLKDEATNALYRLDPNGVVNTMETGVSLANGIGWSPDNETMYFVDSLKQVIYAYDFNLETGTISNRRGFIKVPEEDGIPDGLTVDNEGFVWCAMWGSWKVIRYTPLGKKDREIRMPVIFPTCCAFGGENLDVLYITSAHYTLTEEQRKEHPNAGNLFRLQTDVKGIPEPMFMG